MGQVSKFIWYFLVLFIFIRCTTGACLRLWLLGAAFKVRWHCCVYLRFCPYQFKSFARSNAKFRYLSGCGEQLIQTTLAKTLGQTTLDHGDPAFHMKELMCNQFIHSQMLSDDPYDRMGGVLVAYYTEDSVDFNMAFTTDSMVVGFMTTNYEKATVRVSRNTSTSVPSTSTNDSTLSTRLTMEGFIVKLIN